MPRRSLPVVCGVCAGVAVRVLGSGADAEDVVQESFLALWRQAPRLDPSRGLRSYLLTIVHHKAIDRLRRRGRRVEVTLDPQMALSSPESQGPEAAATRSSEREQVRRALTGLSEEQRRTVEMTYFAGLTMNQAAERLGIPVGTVKSRLRLALDHLRRHLAEQQQ